MSAVRNMLDEEHAELPPEKGDPNGYLYGKMSEHNVVVGWLPQGSQGIGAAATVTAHMQRSFPACQIRLLVGIGSGVPSRANDIRLGDAVIGMPSGIHGGVVQYDLGKETTAGFERKGYLAAPPTAWRTAVVKMQSDHRREPNKIVDLIKAMLQKYPRLKGTYSRPDPKTDVLFEPESIHEHKEPTCGKCEKERVISRDARPSGSPPAIFYGLIASGNRVMKNAVERDRISANEGDVLCFEMEAAGPMNEFPCIVIRAVADYADSHKNDHFHGYAAATAAACAKELLTYIKPDVSMSTVRLPH
jgi:nucleoside phosphorylase